MKILLLGHKGMLGSDLLTQMLLHHEVVGMDKEEIDITSADDCAKAIKIQHHKLSSMPRHILMLMAVKLQRKNVLPSMLRRSKILPRPAVIKILGLFISVLIMFLTVPGALLTKKTMIAIRLMRMAHPSWPVNNICKLLLKII